jgi:hypothetical protein
MNRESFGRGLAANPCCFADAGFGERLFGCSEMNGKRTLNEDPAETDTCSCSFIGCCATYAAWVNLAAVTIEV